MNWLTIGDYFFFVFHLLFIIFILTGWMIYRWRRVHLVAILLTFFSWFVLGLRYGMGYCPLTDWHWQILREAGHRGLPPSYVSYMIERLSGMHLPDAWVDAATALFAVIALVLSLWVNFFRKFNKSTHRSTFSKS